MDSVLRSCMKWGTGGALLSGAMAALVYFQHPNPSASNGSPVFFAAAVLVGAIIGAGISGYREFARRTEHESSLPWYRRWRVMRGMVLAGACAVIFGWLILRDSCEAEMRMRSWIRAPGEVRFVTERHWHRTGSSPLSTYVDYKCTVVYDTPGRLRCANITLRERPPATVAVRYDPRNPEDIEAEENLRGRAPESDLGILFAICGGGVALLGSCLGYCRIRGDDELRSEPRTEKCDGNSDGAQ